MSSIEKLKQQIKDAKHILILTGAGISVDSGIPQFRGPNGLWSEENLKYGSLEYFKKHPSEVNAWYRKRFNIIDAAQPNENHELLASFCIKHKEKITYVTQNIDGLDYVHMPLGIEIIEIHGTNQFIMSEYGPRPDIMFFDETYISSRWVEDYNKVIDAANKSDLILFVGTSLAANITSLIYESSRCSIWYINPDPASDIWVLEQINKPMKEVFTELIK